MSEFEKHQMVEEIFHLKQLVTKLEQRLGAKLVKVVAWCEAGSNGRTAQQWQESYELLCNAIDAHLGQFVFDDDVSEEAIFEETIQRVGFALRNVKFDPEGSDHGWSGTVDVADFTNAARVAAQREEQG